MSDRIIYSELPAVVKGVVCLALKENQTNLDPFMWILASDEWNNTDLKLLPFEERLETFHKRILNSQWANEGVSNLPPSFFQTPRLEK